MAGLHSSATVKMSPPPKLSWLLSLLICLFYFPFHTTTPVCHAASSIYSNKSLTENQTVESNGGNFVLGFFSPGNSTNSHIGIWFKKLSTQTVVWVANRETPILDRSSSELKLSGDGNLVLLDQSKAIIWSTNTTITSNVTTTVAELLDSGNLVLRDGSNSSNVLWQSFDHPTDTWLPDMKIGLNKVTNRNKILTSWKSSEDPAPGIYSFELDPSESSQYFIRWNRSRIYYWSFGPWNGRFFRDAPETRSKYMLNFSYVSNDKENYFIYYVYNNNTITKFDISLFGQIRQQTWLDSTQQWNLFCSRPRAQCQVYSVCGAYGSCNEKSMPYCTCLKGFKEASPKNWDLNNRTGGCTRNTPLQCAGSNSGNGDHDRFYTMSNVTMPDSPQTLAAASDEECKNSCLNNCLCTAYSYGSSGCSVWYGDLLNLQQASDGASNVGTLQLRLAAFELPTSRSKKAVISRTVVAGVVGILALSAAIWLLVWRHNQKEFSKLKLMSGIIVPFKYNHLRQVTKNFSEKLGEGGFGTVFKGTLPDSTVVAVKKLRGIGQGEKQFRAEVSTIGAIQHLNLVRLRGFCSEATEKLLVYEYMPMGSLDASLFRRNKPFILDWKTRYRITLGIARGLAYLHEECRDCIIHCDIKPENILLDACFTPKIADFGLAKLLGRDFSRVLTTMRGTIGYLAPEWIWGTTVTAKADVYSYGMMLFEIISGRRNTEHAEEAEFVYFPFQAANKLMVGEVLDLLDPRLEGDANLEELDRVCRTACWCIQDDDVSRPSTGLVLQILEGVVDVSMPPIPKSLTIFEENPDQILFFSDFSKQGYPNSR